MVNIIRSFFSVFVELPPRFSEARERLKVTGSPRAFQGGGVAFLQRAGVQPSEGRAPLTRHCEDIKEDLPLKPPRSSNYWYWGVCKIGASIGSPQDVEIKITQRIKLSWTDFPFMINCSKNCCADNLFLIVLESNGCFVKKKHIRKIVFVIIFCLIHIEKKIGRNRGLIHVPPLT